MLQGKCNASDRWDTEGVRKVTDILIGILASFFGSKGDYL